MHIFVDILVTIITAYLAFSNFLAGQIANLLPNTEYQPEVTIEEHKKELSLLNSLPSIFNTGNIPDILLKNSEYQQASVAKSTQNYTVTDPNQAIVNIFCTFTTPTSIRTTTGTGFLSIAME